MHNCKIKYSKYSTHHSHDLPSYPLTVSQIEKDPAEEERHASWGPDPDEAAFSLTTTPQHVTGQRAVSVQQAVRATGTDLFPAGHQDLPHGDLAVS